MIFDSALRKANNSSSWVGKTHRKWVRQTLLAISLHLLDRLKAEKRLNLIEFEMPSNWTCNMFDWCINKNIFKLCPNVLILQMFWINYLKSQRTKWITKTLMVCTVCSVLSNWDLFIKLRAAFLALSLLHSSKKEGSSHLDQNISLWWDASAVHVVLNSVFIKNCSKQKSVSQRSDIKFHIKLFAYPISNTVKKFERAFKLVLSVVE